MSQWKAVPVVVAMFVVSGGMVAKSVAVHCARRERPGPANDRIAEPLRWSCTYIKSSALGRITRNHKTNSGNS